jgi:hypothetical protein
MLPYFVDGQLDFIYVWYLNHTWLSQSSGVPESSFVLKLIDILILRLLWRILKWIRVVMKER